MNIESWGYKMPGQLSLLATFAHPDDESFGVGGTLAKYASEGVVVSLLVATDGAAGEISDPSLARPDNLAEVRRRELQCAADTLGVENLRLLGYPDGHLAEVDWQEAEGRIVAIIRELRPDVVITFDPLGVYGHPDHITIHRLTLTACQLAGDSNHYPEQMRTLRPHAPRKLYFRAIPRPVMHLMADRIQLTRAGLGLDAIDTDELATPDELVTTVIEVSQYADLKTRAIECHRTQLTGGDLKTAWSPDMLQELLFREYFSLFGKKMSAGEPLETDLFAGLR